MKKLLLFSIFFYGLIISSHLAVANEAIYLKGHIDDPLTKIHYTISLGQGYYPGTSRVVPVDHEGNFEYEIKASIYPSLLTLTVGENRYSIILEKKHDIRLNIAFIDNAYRFEYTGSNVEGQRFYNSLSHPETIYKSPLFKSLLNADAEKIKDKISENKTQEANQLKLMLSAGTISPPFSDWVKRDRDVFYASLSAAVAQVRYLMIIQDPARDIQEFGTDMQDLWKSAFAAVSAPDHDFLQSRWWYDLTSLYLDHKDYIENKATPQSQVLLRQDNSFHTYRLGLAGKYLSGDILKLYTAQYLQHAANQQKKEKELVKLAADFTSKYPANPYSPLFQTDIDLIIDHYATSDLADGSYRIIEDHTLVNSLKEAVALAEGRPVYLDVWATWCVPCIQEFKHKPAVSQLLEEFGYFPIYISIDMEQHEGRWKKMIAQHELKEGIHIRANGNLNAEIMKLYGSHNSITIPIYAILDPEGQIIVKTAARPSDLVRLRMQLSENFNK